METGPGEPIVTRHAEGCWIWIQLLQPPDNGSSRVFTARKKLMWERRRRAAAINENDHKE